MLNLTPIIDYSPFMIYQCTNSFFKVIMSPHRAHLFNTDKRGEQSQSDIPILLRL